MKHLVVNILIIFFVCQSLAYATENEVYVDEDGNSVTVLDTALRAKIKKNKELNVSTLYDSVEDLEKFKNKYTSTVLSDNKEKIGFYKVQKGDQLKRISQKIYGTQKRWQEIQYLNEEMLAGKGLRPGMKLKYFLDKKE